MERRIKVALAGNPNSGKTCVFNQLTGARQHVGNYPGVTVERKQGVRKHEGIEIEIVDLPGTYSLTASSIEELVARNHIVEDEPDVVVNVLDASNLERNLYLSTQLMELGVPMVLALNMSDVAKARGIEMDLDLLTTSFGAPVVPTVGNKGEGIEELVDTVLAVADGRREARPTRIHYGEVLEPEVEALARVVGSSPTLNGFDPRWLAVKLLEGDRDIAERAREPRIIEALEESRGNAQRRAGQSAETLIAERRYEFISGACQRAVRFPAQEKLGVSDRIDAVVTSRFLAFPIFFGLMYLVFQLTFAVGDPIMGWIESAFGWLAGQLALLWPSGTESPLASLLIDGVIGGVGGVVVFLPNILLLFLAIAVLEGSGYMARAAFIMDRLMRSIGLHGKSFIPLLIGFGCSVPAIMATRTLESRRDRLTTMMVAPLMSCGARLPIYTLIIPAFFPGAWRAPMLWIIYVIGILLAIGSAKLLRSTVFKGASVPFVMELPPYRLPSVRGVLIQMWERGWMYLKKAGTIILGISILLWALTNYPKSQEPGVDQAALASSQGTEQAAGSEPAGEEARRAEQLAHSFAGRIGGALEPVLAPMGFDWKIGTALIGAFAAKEVFVAQMGIVYAVGSADEESEPLRATLQATYSPLVGLCIMLFCLIAAPCMATLAVTRRESGSWGWALLQFGGLTALAWVLTVLVYQVGSFLGWGV